MLRRLGSAAFHPLPLRLEFFRAILRKMTLVPYGTRLGFDAVVRPYYGFCIYNSALLAKALSYTKISVIEFGVAGGNGLVNVERHTEEIRKELGTEFEVYGFDLATGLPKPIDYRDMPYMWAEGFYKMDRAKLEARLSRSTLVIGNVSETCLSFFDEYKPAPIGCVLFDLDYYSSTLDAFKIFDTDPSNYLPRVYCYFDDVVSGGLRANNECVGVLRAIAEFNEQSPDRQILKIQGLSASRKVPASWNEQSYVLHNFSHPQYCDFIGNRLQILPLK